MSTLHKVKAYFGMAPMDDYDDEYYEDDERSSRGAYPRRPRDERFEDDSYGRMDARGYDDRMGGREFEREFGRDMEPAPAGYRGGYGEDESFRGRREFERPRFNTLRGATRGAVAMEPRRMAELFEAGSPLAKITTLRPKDYSEARTIGERFRDGTPVIMDLVSMDNADAKRLVDFAAGLAFALRGSFDKVATKVFLLSPSGTDVSAEERKRIAEAGFYAYQ
ncbi:MULTISPECIES: cell division protein SepF [unclassified Mycolicibacterium]|jgi:cell division inhibitor SepF|uniref:cell division protein SepF n=1 Tax=unclassified Mycolicibacterium TaxID=2636767 RepID=UPI001F4C216B|nr:cell division protein SepF [Mycolicibacterium sp. YH-1]UNB55206.1 cell division protein SepF [Mycolicibacterium sp. YH-1]